MRYRLIVARQHTGYQTNRKICDPKANSHSACDCRAILAKQHYKLAFARKKLNNEINYSEMCIVYLCCGILLVS